MYKTYKYKKQGDNTDSWIVSEWEDNTKKVLLNTYMIYEDPTIEKLINISKADISSLKPKQIADLKILLGI